MQKQEKKYYWQQELISFLHPLLYYYKGSSWSLRGTIALEKKFQSAVIDRIIDEEMCNGLQEKLLATLIY